MSQYVYNKHNTTWKVLSPLYGIYELVVFVSEILLVRCVHSFDFCYVNNLCVNTVRQHFPRSILYIYLQFQCIFIRFDVFIFNFVVVTEYHTMMQFLRNRMT